MSKRTEDLTGQKFGRLTVLSFSEYIKRRAHWNCLCDCGNEKVIRGSSLKSGHTTSCGCLDRKWLEKHGLTTGGKNRRLHGCWSAMLSRCYNPADVGHKNYMQKGITVCEEWKEDFAVFHAWAIDNGYDDTLTLDRRDNDEGYSPDNCRWVSMAEQNQNRGSNVLNPDKVRYIRAECDKNRTFTSIARELKVSRTTVHDVIVQRTWKNIV